MTRNVDKGEVHVLGLQVREPEIDRDPALLLLLEPVRIRAGECADESALPVVDVPGSTDDDGFQRRPFFTARSFRPGRCFRLPALEPAARAPFSPRRVSPWPARDRGVMRLCRGPRLLSDFRTRSRISERPRSTCRRSMSTLTTWTVTRSPSRYTLPVFS